MSAGTEEGPSTAGHRDADPLCSAAETALLIDVDKGVRPCCAYEGKHLSSGPSVAKLGAAKLDEILSGPEWSEVRDQLARHEVPPGCHNCIERESRVGSSQRLTMKRRESANWRKGITYLEVNSSNVCNLQCRHCSPLFSSRWAKHKQKAGDDSAKVVLPDGDLLLSNLRRLDLQHLEYVAIKGGEPMLNSDMLVLLEHLDAIGVIGKLTLHMVTNGTVTSPPLLELMGKARKCEVCLSVDGAGDVQTYIRHGSSAIERLEEAVAIYAGMANVTLSRNTAVMAYNVFCLDAIDKWWDSLPARFPGAYARHKYGLFVLWPQALAVHCLQDHTRAALCERYRAIDADYYAPVIRVLEQPFAGERRHNEFVRLTQKNDVELGRSVLDAVPELADEMVMLVRPVEEHIAECWSMIDNGEVAAAELLSSRIVEDPDAPMTKARKLAALHVQAVAVALSGDVPRALDIIGTAIDLGPEIRDLRLHRGRMLLKLGRADAAREDALAALEDPRLVAEARTLLHGCDHRSDND